MGGWGGGGDGGSLYEHLLRDRSLFMAQIQLAQI